MNKFWKNFFDIVLFTNAGGVCYFLYWIQANSTHPLHVLLFKPIETFSRIDPHGDYTGTMLSFILALIAIAAFTCVNIANHYSSHVKKGIVAKAGGWLDRACWMVFSWSIVISAVAVALPPSAIRFVQESFPGILCSLMFGLLMAGVIILAYTSEAFIVMSVTLLNKKFNALDRRSDNNLSIGEKAYMSFAGPLSALGGLILMLSSFSGLSVLGIILIDPSQFHSMLGSLIKLHLVIICFFIPLAWLSNHDHKALIKFIFLNLIFVPFAGRGPFRFGGGSSGGAGASSF